MTLKRWVVYREYPGGRKAEAFRAYTRFAAFLWVHRKPRHERYGVEKEGRRHAEKR
ncbi:hypothetical protein [Rhizobium phage RHph_X2_26]|nr:hypothetical protein [Rhizobium phage RHph_X2_26]